MSYHIHTTYTTVFERTNPNGLFDYFINAN
jgi:hypothetical protein